MEISKTLEGDGEKPLSAFDSMAELCYGIDNCAQDSSESELDEACRNEGEYGDEDLHPSNLCYTRKFREKHSCSSGVKKDSIQSVQLMREMLSDSNQIYTSMMYPNLLSFFSGHHGVSAGTDSSEIERVMSENPYLHHLVSNVGSLAQYTMDCYDKMNPILFRNDSKLARRHFNLFRSVIDTMELLPDFKGKVNRGVNLPESVLKEHHKIGNVVCYNGFTSTAVHHASDTGSKPRNSFLSGKCTQRIYISYQEGAKPGKLIDSASASRGENEVLFSPGACFRVDKVYPRTDKVESEEEAHQCGEGEHYVFEMTLVK